MSLHYVHLHINAVGRWIARYLLSAAIAAYFSCGGIKVGYAKLICVPQTRHAAAVIGAVFHDARTVIVVGATHRGRMRRAGSHADSLNGTCFKARVMLIECHGRHAVASKAEVEWLQQLIAY